MMSLLRKRARQLTNHVTDRIAARMTHGTPLLGELPSAPPGPPGTVLMGNTTEGYADPLSLFLRCSADYGPMVRLRFGPYFYYLVNDPELVQHVFVKNARNYKKSRYYRGIQIVLGDGLFTSEGDFWRRQRKLSQPAFHRESLNSFAATMSDSTRDMVTRLKGLSGQQVSLEKEMSHLALRIVCRTLFSAELDGDGDAINRAVHFANEFGNSAYYLPMWVPTKKNREIKRAMAVFDDFFSHMLAERRRSGQVKNDLLGMLMAARDDETGEGMTERQLRDEALTLIIGGHETTATVLSWTFYLLSKHPEIERKLRAHILDVLGDRDPTAEDVHKLSYVTQVVQESMRLYPPAWVMEREAIADDELAGYRIPAGATLAVSSYVLHRHPELWPNPEGFDPDRFAPERVKARAKHTYLPFGSGPRICIGNSFAMMETVIILSMIVREMSLDLVAGHPVELEPMMTLRPKHGIRMVPRQLDAPRAAMGRAG